MSNFDNESVTERKVREDAARLARINASKNLGRTFAPSVNDASNGAGRFGLDDRAKGEDADRVTAHKIGQLKDFYQRRYGRLPTDAEVQAHLGTGE